jgi:hypothetical protein
MDSTIVNSIPAESVAFYAVTDSHHFIGVVGLVNSLRLVGHTEPIFVTDAGMQASQRAMLETTATVIDPPDGTPPQLAKPFAPLLHPAEVMVLLDADVLVVRHLQPLLETASSGNFVCFEDATLPGRFFEQWSNLDLGIPEKKPYAIAGHYLGPSSRILPMLREVARLQQTLDIPRTYFGDSGDINYPYYFADQDIMNAYLMTSVDADAVVRIDSSLSPVPPFTGIRRVEGLRCVGRGDVEPYLLHHFLGKPWLVPTRFNVYVDVLRRVLWDPDAPVALDPHSVPMRLGPSRLSRVDQAWTSMQLRAREAARFVRDAVFKRR